MNKRLFTLTSFTTASLIMLFVMLLFLLLPTVESTDAAGGVCTRFSLNQGRSAMTGAGIAGRYEMHEVTTGRLLATWQAGSQAINSGRLTDLPTVADGGSWVEVYFYPNGSETAVALEILNPAPNTSYGWVANGRCHAIEIQFPTDWMGNQDKVVDQTLDAAGGGGEVTETPQEESTPESGTDLSGLQQEWIPNLNNLQPITDIRIVDLTPPLEAGRMGAWQDGSAFGYGFTLINSSADHYIVNVEYRIIVSGADGNISEERTVRLRKLYPLEEVNVGEFFFVNSEVDYDTVEISVVSAESVEITAVPSPLKWQPNLDANFSETGIWIRQRQVDENDAPITPEDTNEVQFNFEVINPNGAFVATNSTFSISVFDDAGTILGQSQGAIGDILPLQSWELKGSFFVQSPERVNNAQIVIEPEQFTPIDPATLPSQLIQKEDIRLEGQNANIVFPGQIDFEFHLTEMITDSGMGSVVAVAYDNDGVPIGGGYHRLLGNQLTSTARSIFMPILASELPGVVEFYVSYDSVDYGPPRGGGGSHPGRDI